jgi:hypothetical protein
MLVKSSRWHPVPSIERASDELRRHRNGTNAKKASATQKLDKRKDTWLRRLINHTDVRHAPYCTYRSVCTICPEHTVLCAPYSMYGTRHVRHAPYCAYCTVCTVRTARTILTYRTICTVCTPCTVLHVLYRMYGTHHTARTIHYVHCVQHAHQVAFEIFKNHKVTFYIFENH